MRSTRRARGATATPLTPPAAPAAAPATATSAPAAEATKLGGALYMPPADFEDIGRISIMADPQGAAFAIFKAAARRAALP